MNTQHMSVRRERMELTAIDKNKKREREMDGEREREQHMDNKDICNGMGTEA